MLVLRPKPTIPPAEPTRNKTGIKSIFDRALTKSQRVTLEQAIAILRAAW